MVVDGEEKVINGSGVVLPLSFRPPGSSGCHGIVFKDVFGDQHIMVQLFNAIIKDYNMSVNNEDTNGPWIS